MNEIITSLTENYHELGHLGSDVDAMIDTVSGMGHRIKWGHDLEGIINSFELDGISGVGEWFNHIFKDFTSTDGIPLPFANAIHNITGMDMDNTIDWLCINAADVIEVGGEAAAIQLFKNNPKLYKASIVVGTILGIIDDNPLLLGYNTILLLSKMKKSGRIPTVLNKSLSFLNRGMKIVSNAAIATAAADIGLGIVGVDLAGSLGHVFNLVSHTDHADVAGFAADAVDGASTIADIFDGFATLGLGIAASKGVKYIFEKLNEDKRKEYSIKKVKLSWAKTLENMVKSKASPSQIADVIEMAIDNGVYKMKF